MTKQDKNIESIYPLSPTQQGMLFHSLLAPKSGVYFNQWLCVLTGSFQKAVWQRAWQDVVERHEPLRTLFVWEGQEKPLQVVRRRVALPSQELDWRALSADEQTVKLEEFLRTDRQRGFDLGRAPLMRLTLIRVNESHYELVWSYHHLIMDGWSAYLVLTEMVAVYEAISQGREYASEPRSSYRAYIHWLQGQDLSKAEEFWRAALKGFTAPTPLWGNRLDEGRAKQDYEIAAQISRPSSSLSAALRSFGGRHDLTLSSLVHGAWALLLNRYSGEEDVIFGSTVSGRPPELRGVESTVGLFINTLPVRARFSPQDLVLAWLKDFQNQLMELRRYEYSPLVEVQGWSDVRYGQPLFESLVDFVNYPVDASVSEQRSTTLKISNIRSVERTNYPLVLVVQQRKELAIKIYYETRRFDAAAVTRMLGHFSTLLESIVSNPEQRLSDLPLLTSAERQQIVVEWNRTEVDYPRDRCLHEFIEEQAERTPEAVAVVFEDQQLTYRQLNERANQLAHYLQKLGVGPDTLVGICVERSAEMVLGLLGILKAGGAYVPLDPEYPRERLAFMLEDAGVPVLLTQAHLTASLPIHQARLVRLDADWPLISKESAGQVTSSVGAEHLAYMIYTSGSTGRPKGVLIQHQSLVNFLKAMEHSPGITEEDKLLSVTSLSFDISGLELYLPLIVGAQVTIAPRQVAADGSRLASLIKECGATIMQATPTTWRLLLEAGWEGSQHLKILCGGEAWSTELARVLLPRCASLWNMYGPTETTVWSSVAKIEANQPVLVGPPIANTTFYVLDRNCQPVPIGVPGELHIGGIGLARGYHNRTEATAEKFIPDPFRSEPGARLYKTGDLARYLPNGAVEYLGRLDHQVKIRGFRIELGEIESVLAALPGVRETVVVAREDVPGDKRLVAYLTVKEGEAPKVSELRGLLQAKLPDYMVPSSFVTLDRFPLTPNGKVDRKALPQPNLESKPAEFEPPSSATEKALANIWGEALGIKQVGLYDNFFELGGHSLLAVRVIGKINKTLQLYLNVPTFFQNPTIERLAKALERGHHVRPKPQVVPLQPGHTGLPLYFIGAGPVEIRIAKLMGEDRAVFGTDVPMPMAWRRAIAATDPAAWPTLAQLGALHGDVVRAHAGSSPCVLAGYSFGGKVVFEAARALQRAGGNVAFVLLIDAFAWGGVARGTGRRNLRRLLWRLLGRMLREVKGRFARAGPGVVDDAAGFVDEEGTPVELPVMKRLFRILVKSSQPRPLDASGVLFRAKVAFEKMLPEPDLTNGWGDLFTQGLEIVQTTGDHWSLVRDEQNTAVLARQINAVLDRDFRTEKQECALEEAWGS